MVVVVFNHVSQYRCPNLPVKTLISHEPYHMNYSENRSLRRLLLTHELAFLVLVAVAGAVGGASAYFWRVSSEEAIRINELAHEAQEIRSEAYRQLNEVALAKLRDDPEAETLFAKYTRSIKERFNRLRRDSKQRDEAYGIQELQQHYALFREDMARVFDDAVLLNRVVRSRIIDPAYMDKMTAGFERAFQNFRGLLNQKLTEQQSRIAKWSEIAPYVIPIPLVVAVVLLLFSRFSVMRGVVIPIQKMVSEMRSLAGKEQLVSVDADRSVSEVMSLADGINAMNAELLASRDALIEKRTPGGIRRSSAGGRPQY